MVIIKCNALLPADDFINLWRGFVEMAETGVLLLPYGCDLLNEVPPDTEVVVVKPGEATEGSDER
jgi:hypothetical protein